MTRALSRGGINPQVLTGRFAGVGRRTGGNPWEMLLGLVASSLMEARPQFMTLLQASDHSGLSVTFLKRLIDLRKLPALRDGRTVKVRRADLDTLPSVAKLAKLTAVRGEIRRTLASRRGK